MQAHAALNLFATLFPGDSDPVVAQAPGRINLIGEHTDYNGGFVFPAALTQGITVVARPNGLSVNRLHSVEAGAGQEFPVDVQPGQVDSWSKYAAGMAWVLGAKTCVDAVVSSDLPMASGVSSSAAIEMAFGVLWNHLDNLGHDNKQLALLAQKCENQFVGVNCGIMDQMASAMGKEGHAILLDSENLEIEYAPVPKGLSLFVCDTGKARTLAGSAYNDRRASCEQASRVLNVPSLRHASISQVETLQDPILLKRARHVVTENQRCLDFRAALTRQDKAALGRLMAESHASLRDDYEVSCFELDTMVEASLESAGCIGARMTGAGFGGCCVALVDSASSELFRIQTEHNYRKKVQSSGPTVLESHAGTGAAIVQI